MPEDEMELLAPSEYLGILEGGINGTIWANFSSEGLNRFCVIRENDGGGSIAPIFQCYVLPYADWFEGYDQFIPTREKPLTPYGGVVVYLREFYPLHILRARIAGYASPPSPGQ